MTVNDLVLAGSQEDVSDIHLVCGIPPMCRQDGSLRNLFSDAPLTHEDCEGFAREIAGEEDCRKIAVIGELDLAKTIAGRRVRINLFRQQGHISVALRLLNEKIPELSSLGLPPAVSTLPDLRSGIVIVTGETGSGKSTTLAAVLQQINRSYYDHIITLEDPIEYLYCPDKCVINQREIGQDTENYADGLRAVLREDPDVILIGEMRDLVTIETALTAAETGHLVFATLHTQSAADSIDRMVDVFPEGRQKQIRMQLSMTLRAVLAQQLLPKIGGGRVAACEIMMVNPAIKNLIREGKTPQIENALQTSANLGSVTMDNSIIRLYREHIISAEVARTAARDAEYIKKQIL